MSTSRKSILKSMGMGGGRGKSQGASTDDGAPNGNGVKNVSTSTSGGGLLPDASPLSTRGRLRDVFPDGGGQSNGSAATAAAGRMAGDGRSRQAAAPTTTRRSIDALSQTDARSTNAPSARSLSGNSDRSGLTGANGEIRAPFRTAMAALEAGPGKGESKGPAASRKKILAETGSALSSASSPGGSAPLLPSSQLVAAAKKPPPPAPLAASSRAPGDGRMRRWNEKQQPITASGPGPGREDLVHSPVDGAKLERERFALKPVVLEEEEGEEYAVHDPVARRESALAKLQGYRKPQPARVGAAVSNGSPSTSDRGPARQLQEDAEIARAAEALAVSEEPDVEDDEALPRLVRKKSIPGGWGAVEEETEEEEDDDDDEDDDFEDVPPAQTRSAEGHAKRNAVVVGAALALASPRSNGSADVEEDFYDEAHLQRKDGHDVEVPDVEEDVIRDDDAEAAALHDDPSQIAAAQALMEEEERQAQQAARQSKAKVGGGAAPSQRRTERLLRLDPVQRHYLLKALISLQMQQEWGELEKLGTLTQYGYPFSAQRPSIGKRVKGADDDNEIVKGEYAKGADDPYADDDAARRAENIQEPLITRHLFHTHLRIFPGLDAAPLKFWQKRIQPFFDEMAARNFSFGEERSQLSLRRFYTLTVTRYLGNFFARGFGVRGEGELRGPGRGEPGSEKWGVGKQWGKGTVKRGLAKPTRLDAPTMDLIDTLFDGREGEVWRRARKETTRVRRDWLAFKEHVIENETGLNEIMTYLDIGNIRNLPPHLRSTEEYARQFAAYLLHTLLVASPGADGTFTVIKGIHLLFPYWGAKQLLRVANAQTMIEGILSMLLARPGGAKSLVQRIFSYVIGKEATSIQKEYIVPLRKEIADDELTKKIDEYVKRGLRPEARAMRARSRRTGLDILATILLHSTGSQISEAKKRQILDMEKAFAASPYRGDIGLAYPPSTPIGKKSQRRVPSWNAGPNDAEAARRYALLKLHLRECLRKRDREQAIAIAGGTLIPKIIRDALQTVFYPAIAEIARHADLADRLGDLQNFVDDLIKLKKSGATDMPSWIALAARHENSLFFIFHECAPIMKEFESWLQVGTDYMAMGTTDPSHPANRKAKNLEVNLEELLQDDRLSDADVDALIDEVDRLALWIRWQKIAYELDMRKNFILAKPEAAAMGLSEDDVPRGPMREQINDTDGLLRRLMDKEGVPVEDGVTRSTARGSEMEDYAFAWYDALDPIHQHIASARGAPIKFRPPGVSAPIPTSEHIRKALPLFQDVLREKLPRWGEGDALGPPSDAAIKTPAALAKGALAQSQGQFGSSSARGKGGNSETASAIGTGTTKSKKGLFGLRKK